MVRTIAASTYVTTTLQCNHTTDLHEILFQVARNEIEESDIRNHAIEAIVDMATVYEQRYRDDPSLTMLLLRLQEQSEPALLRVGAECSAKLLFNGRLSDPKLFSNLVKFFFLPQLAGEVEEADSGECELIPADAYIGSLPRLQQILSVFFQVFFMGGNTWDSIAFRCTSDLLSDLSMSIRDGALDPTAITMVRGDSFFMLRGGCSSLSCMSFHSHIMPYHYHMMSYHSQIVSYHSFIMPSHSFIMPYHSHINMILTNDAPFLPPKMVSRLLALCENINLPVSSEIREEHSMAGKIYYISSLFFFLILFHYILH